MGFFFGELFVVLLQPRFYLNLLGKQCPYGDRANENRRVGIVRDPSSDCLLFLDKNRKTFEKLE